MPLFGSHLSIAGGYFKAVQKAKELGFASLQIFTKNNNQWKGKPISAADRQAFVAARSAAGMLPTIAHDSYLINLASPDPALWERSITALIDELRRAHTLGIDHVVSHPGAHMGAGEEAGLTRVAEALDSVFAATADLPTTVALETTAGQGTSLGHRFEHLAHIIGRCSFPTRLTACIDTCHVFAAGYALAPRRAYLATMRSFDRLVGFDRLVAFHLNDSKRERGSRVDRHEHIGNGRLGDEPFRHVVNDRRFRRLPMILETAKEDDPKSGRAWDTINLERLQRLLN